MVLHVRWLAWLAPRLAAAAAGQDLPGQARRLSCLPTDEEPEHGGPARLLVPPPLPLEERQMVHGIQLLDQDEPGFWESLGYHNYGDPWREQRFWGD